jgi:hypothetical protein
MNWRRFAELLASQRTSHHSSLVTFEDFGPVTSAARERNIQSGLKLTLYHRKGIRNWLACHYCFSPSLLWRRSQAWRRCKASSRTIPTQCCERRNHRHQSRHGHCRQSDYNEDGLYRVPALYPGRYSVEAKANGFATARVNETRLKSDKRRGWI